MYPSPQGVLEGGLVGQDPANSTERPVHGRDPVVESGEVKGCVGHGDPVRGKLHGQVE